MKNKDQILLEDLYNKMNNPVHKLTTRINHAKKTGNKAELELAYDEVRMLAKKYPHLLKDPEFLDIIPDDVLPTQ